MGKVAKVAGTAAVVGAVAVTAVAIGGGAYLLYKSHESHRQNASTTRLHIRLKDAQNLIAADRGGTSDPYVTIKVSNLKAKSSSKSKTLNPTWNEDYDMGIENRTGRITIKVWDKDLVSDDPLGRAELDLATVPMDYPHEYKLHLTNKKHQGVVNLSMWITNSLSTSEAWAGTAVAPEYPQQQQQQQPQQQLTAGYTGGYATPYPSAYGTGAYPPSPAMPGYPPSPAMPGYPPAGYSTTGYPAPAITYPPAYGTGAYPPSPAMPGYASSPAMPSYPPAGYPPAGYPAPDPYAYGTTAYPTPGYPPPSPQPYGGGYPPTGSPAAYMSPPAGYPQQGWFPPPQ